MATENDFAALSAKRNTDTEYAALCNKLLTKADEILTDGYSTYDDTDAVRLTAAGEIGPNIILESFAYKLTGDRKYFARAIGEMENAASFSDWNHVKHYLDTASIANGFSIGYDWLYNDLSTTQRNTFKAVLNEKCLNPAMLEYRSHYCNTDWARITSNWNFVCNSGNLMTALAIVDEEDLFNDACEVIQNSMRSLSYAAVKFSDDGSWYEGPIYGEYAISFYLPAIAALKGLLGTDCGFLSYSGIDAYKDFAVYSNGVNEVFNFGDGGEAILESPELMYYSKECGNNLYGAYRYNQLMNNTAAHINVIDVLYYSDAYKNNQCILKDKLFSSINTAVFHGDVSGASASFAGLHGDFNNVTHGHLDAGSFVYDACGVRFASDLGQDNYNLYNYWLTSETNEKNRWGYYRTRAEGHNTLVINPDNQADQTVNSTSPVVAYETYDNYGFSIVDTSEAYSKNAFNAKRGLLFNRTNNSCLVEDEVNLRGKSDVYWFMQTAARGVVAADGKSAVLTRWGKRIWIGVLTEGATLEMTAAAPFESSPNPDEWAENIAHSGDGDNPKTQANNGFYRKVSVKLADVNGFQRIAVYMVPLADGENVPASLPQVKALSLWK